jgi:protocatechuate 3,4-dioxygenase beta subunit
MTSRRAVIAALVPLVVGWIRVPASAQSCPPTKPDMLGPFYVPGAPERNKTGEGLQLEGLVRSTRDCKTLPGATIEWWAANPQGEYDDAHRATQVADASGRFRYVTDMPGKYPGRPVHLHVKVSAPGHKPLVTQVYPKPGDRAIAQDFVLLPA